MASNGTGWDEFGLWMALSTGQRCLDASPKGCTGCSVRENGGAKDQDGHHSCDLLSDYP
jgi:hypothetical protein